MCEQETENGNGNVCTLLKLNKKSLKYDLAYISFAYGK